ncbi:MAG: ferrochelatase [Candidatus Heimdallarchaeota archaeon]
MIVGSGFEYDLMLREIKKIDYSEIGITVEQTTNFTEADEIHDLLATKIENVVESEFGKAAYGVILVCDGQPTEWDEKYSYPQDIDTYVKSLTKKLVARGFKEDAIEPAWLNYRSPDIELCFDSLMKKGYKKIIYVAATNPIDNIDSLYEIPTIMNKLAEKEGINLVSVKGWNDDDEFFKAYLGLIANAKALDLAELGRDAKIALQANKVGAALTSTEESEEELEDKSED